MSNRATIMTTMLIYILCRLTVSEFVLRSYVHISDTHHIPSEPPFNLALSQNQQIRDPNLKRTQAYVCVCIHSCNQKNTTPTSLIVQKYVCVHVGKVDKC